MTSFSLGRRTLLTGSAAALAFPMLARKANAQTPSLKLAWIRQFAPAGLVQKEAELAKAEGLNVELVGFTRGLDGLVALQKGDAIAADCLIGYSQFALALSQGIDVTMISGSALGLNSILISPRLLDKGTVDDKNKAYIGTEPWKHLVGRTIGMARGSQAEFLMRGYMKTHGLDINKDAKFVDLKTNTDQALALQQGSIDVAVLVEPSATTSRIAGYGVLLAYPYDAGEFARLNSGLIVRTDALKQYPEELQKLVNAHVKAIKFYQSDRAALVTDTARATLFDTNAMTHLLNPQAKALNPKYWLNLEFDYRLPRTAIELYAKNLYDFGGLRKDVSKEIAAHLDYSMLAKATNLSRSELGA
jgi:ABC-type nitrate/sulfonate/bicarbonate transport system substrate-binding protein